MYIGDWKMEFEFENYTDNNFFLTLNDCIKEFSCPMTRPPEYVSL